MKFKHAALIAAGLYIASKFIGGNDNEQEEKAEKESPKKIKTDSGKSSSVCSSNSDNDIPKGMCEVTFKGVVQLNGPISINDTVRMSSKQGKMYTSSKRYEVIRGWVNANYPGCKIANDRAVNASVKYSKFD